MNTKIKDKTYLIVNSHRYNTHIIASRIADTRLTDEYKRHKDLQYELTMSCEKHEAIYQLKMWMTGAILSGNKTYDLNLRAKFLAAYDIVCSLN